jgi:hypothetical protein
MIARGKRRNSIEWFNWYKDNISYLSFRCLAKSTSPDGWVVMVASFLIT